MAIFSFNLINQPWIPCVTSTETNVKPLSLRETLARSAEIVEIADTSPLVVAAIHRFLLAVVHRVANGPATMDHWHDLWTAGELDIRSLDAYLEKHRHRFDLFDSIHPFYQTAGLDYAYETSISKLVHELASGHNATLFDHTLESSPPGLTSAQAARYLVAFQPFAVGGLITREKGQAPSANDAPLKKGAVALVKGANLFQTILLNLHHYAADAPFTTQVDDMPAWEKDTGTLPQDSTPKGYLDLLTWQSRRVRLHPLESPEGETLIRRVVIMQGQQFTDAYAQTAHQNELFIAYRLNKKPSVGQPPASPISFRETRALWRDSTAILQVSPEVAIRPRILDWLSDLMGERLLDPALTLRLDFCGLASDRAKVNLWRHERLPLPLAYLMDKDLVGKLSNGLALTEDVGKLFRPGFDSEIINGKKVSHPRPFQRLATALLAPATGNPDQDTVRKLVVRLNPEAAYWPALEAPFKRFMVDLADQWPHYDPDAEDAKPLPAQQEWAGQVEKAARNAFATATSGLDTSARSLKALALAERTFGTRLRRILKATTETPKAAGGDSDSTANAN